MLRFTKINGVYDVKPEQCPFYIEDNSIVIYNEDRSVITIHKPMSFIKNNDIIKIDLKNGKTTTNDDGQLGLGHYNNVNVPTKLNVGFKVNKVSCGYHTIAMTDDGLYDNLHK